MTWGDRCEKDDLWISCHLCNGRIGLVEVEHDAKLPPWKVIKMQVRIDPDRGDLP